MRAFLHSGTRVFATLGIMNNWTEIRTAFHVGRLGTVSAAADFLGVHRATVIRHIETLESYLGEKLFHRHSRGYTPTDLGRDLMQVAYAAEEKFRQLQGRAKRYEKEMSGELVVASIEDLTLPLVPALKIFRTRYPEIVLRIANSGKPHRLEYGEAHIAFRIGSKPDHPDQVVQLFSQFKWGLYASRDYVEQNGSPENPADYRNHAFVGFDNTDTEHHNQKWFEYNGLEENIILKSTTPSVLYQAVASGLGIGFMPIFRAKSFSNLIEIGKYDTDWESPIWLVTHVDLHRSPKVQAFTNLLKTEGYLGAVPSA